MLGRLAGLGGLRAGDLVEVRTEQEILQTLDEHGKRDALPFMPEMLKYCGRRFRVDRIAHKTCDTINYSGSRRLGNTVHLEGVRCDGSAHGGCGAGCLMFWKEAWLRPVREAAAAGSATRDPDAGSACSLADLERSVWQPTSSTADVQYQCQITELLRASSPYRWWNPRQYLADVVSGNWTLRHVVSVLVLACLRRLIRYGVAYRLLVGAHDWLALRSGLDRYSEVTGQYGPIPKGSKTPASDLVVRPDDWVSVKPRQQIIATLNSQGRNRGLHFDPEMVGFCGGTYRVERLVTHIINEADGRMMVMKGPCIALEGVHCRGSYSNRRLLCPRAIAPYWRSAWLQQTEAPNQSEVGQAG